MSEAIWNRYPAYVLSKQDIVTPAGAQERSEQWEPQATLPGSATNGKVRET